MSELRDISQLVNAHKVSAILLPLIEACEINRRQQSVKQMELPELFGEVVETGKLIMQELSREKGDLFQMDELPDHLLMVLSKALGNSVILYNQPSLSLFYDDAISIFKACKVDLECLIALSGSGDNSKANQKTESFVVACLLDAMLPVLLFNANLFLSGIVRNQQELNELNQKSCAFMIEMINRIISKFEVEQGKHNSLVKESNVSLTCTICAHSVKDFQSKLIKNKSSLKSYIDNPSSILAKLIPAIISNINAMNHVVASVIKR